MLFSIQGVVPVCLAAVVTVVWIAAVLQLLIQLMVPTHGSARGSNQYLQLFHTSQLLYQSTGSYYYQQSCEEYCAMVGPLSTVQQNKQLYTWQVLRPLIYGSGCGHTRLKRSRTTDHQ